MQGNMFRITTLRGKSPLGKKNGESSCKRYIKFSAWMDMRQAWAIWLIIKVREAGIRLNEAEKSHDNFCNLTDHIRLPIIHTKTYIHNRDKRQE